MPAASSKTSPIAPRSSSKTSSALVRFLFEPVPMDLLVYFRFIFGGIMLWEVFRYVQRGLVQAMYVQPIFHFKYYGFGWIEPWSALGMKWHFIVLGIAAFCMMIGFCYRLAAVIVFLSFSYIFLLDQAYYLNHFYLVSVVSFIMCLLPAHRAHSIDALLRPAIKTNIMPAWMLWLLRLQIGIPYFFGAIAKMESDWLSGVPVLLMVEPAENFPVMVSWFSEPVVVFFFTFSGLLFDLLIVPALLWRRTRWLAVAAAIIFNGTNHWLFQIGIFPWFMLLSTPLFFPPTCLQEGDEWVKDVQKKGKEQFAKWTTSWKPTLVIVLLSLHFSIQIFLPFRHFLYPGRVNWTEEGHRFAWHMKLRIKETTDARFFARSTSNKILQEFNVNDYLNNRQARTMPKRPDMILQFAHLLAEDYAKKHNGKRVAITAEIYCSLNFREPQLLVDPHINLAAIPRNLKHARWVLPLNTPYISLQSVKDLPAENGQDELPPSPTPLESY
ncbi:hypothetical protein MNBD_PLANCTO02-139 [hydrothermal vent metagenome]|uniref:HTTM-like domain-containing protein n=1 Tax=hydrothermal vent metagenome TaxID=652676 RepID=A0A3B1DPB6_9ZZZZ